MLQFSCPDHFTGGVIDQSQPCCPGSGVNFQPERLQVRPCYGCLEHNGEGISFQDSRFTLSEQYPCSSWMDWGKRLFVGIKDKHPAHDLIPRLPDTGPPDEPGN